MVDRVGCGGLMINIWFSKTDIVDWSGLTESIDVVDKYTCFEWSKREFWSERGEISLKIPIKRSRDSNGRLGVIEDCSSSWFSN